ncbi:MAG: SGNH/GDSL hydrolase family protein, partial [Planctomycetota bacterium]|nr:SGNH/GDSL hydrolase family protein [Planctomycetota bacterium]
MERGQVADGIQREARVGKKLLLLCVVVALCLLTAEVALRARGIPSLKCQFVSATFDGELFVEDPDRLWRLSPTCQKFEVNEVGLRGWWPDEPAPEGELRILCVGDSCTFGTGVRYDETYGVVLARTLSESRLQRKARAVLLALPGYSTYQDLVLLRQRADELQPDLVV